MLCRRGGLARSRPGPLRDRRGEVKKRIDILVYIYIYIYTHIHTHIHIYIHRIYSHIDISRLLHVYTCVSPRGGTTRSAAAGPTSPARRASPSSPRRP